MDDYKERIEQALLNPTSLDYLKIFNLCIAPYDNKLSIAERQLVIEQVILNSKTENITINRHKGIVFIYGEIDNKIRQHVDLTGRYINNLFGFKYPELCDELIEFRRNTVYGVPYIPTKTITGFAQRMLMLREDPVRGAMREHAFNLILNYYKSPSTLMLNSEQSEHYYNYSLLASGYPMYSQSITPNEVIDIVDIAKLYAMKQSDELLTNVVRVTLDAQLLQVVSETMQRPSDSKLSASRFYYCKPCGMMRDEFLNLFEERLQLLQEYLEFNKLLK